jgi:hypothetical protein
MILDKENLFSEDQVIAGTIDNTTGYGTNIIDLGNDDAAVQALNEKGGELLVQVTADFASGTSMQVVLQSDDDEAFGSPTTLVSSAAVVTASLKAGYQYRLALPEINEQYLRVSYVVAGTMTTGKVLAGIVVDKQTNN